MAKFVCECSYTLSLSKVKFINKDGQLVSEVDIFCPMCHKIMKIEFGDMTIGEVEFAINKFDSMSDQEKKAMIHKRAQKHYQKFAKADVEQKRHETISGIKQKFEEGIQ